MKEKVILSLILFTVLVLWGDWEITTGEFTDIDTMSPAQEIKTAQVDENHVVAISSCQLGFNSLLVGWVLEYEELADAWLPMNSDPILIDGEAAFEPDIKYIDDIHFLVVYRGVDDQGRAAILTVDVLNGSFTASTPVNFNDDSVGDLDLCRVDDFMGCTYLLCSYMGGADYSGWISLLSVDHNDWTISELSNIQFSTESIHYPELCMLSLDKYVCVYTGQSAGSTSGKAKVITVNTFNWTMEVGETCMFDDAYCWKPDVLATGPGSCVIGYRGENGIGNVINCIVDIFMNLVVPGEVQNFGSDNDAVALAGLDDEKFLCVSSNTHNGTYSSMESFVGDFDNISGELEIMSSYTAEPGVFCNPELLSIGDSGYMCGYTGGTFSDPGTYSVMIHVDDPASEQALVYGTVYAEQGGEQYPLAFVDIYYESMLVATTDHMGTYWVDVAAGYCELTASAEGYEELTQGLEVVAGETYTLDFVLTATIPEVGWLSLFAYEMINDVQVPISGAELDLGAGYSPQTNPDGMIMLDLDPGTYNCILTKNNYDTVNFEVEITLYDTTEVEIEMECQNIDMGTVEGQVIYLTGTYPLPLEGAELIINDEVMATSDAGGNFAFNIMPGEYGLFCTADSYMDNSQTIYVNSGSTTSVMFIMEPWNPDLGYLMGQVIYLEGMYPHPIVGAEIYNGMILLDTTDENGEFDAEMEAGTYELTCVAEGYESVTEQVLIIAGEETDHCFIMEPAGGDTGLLTGQVLYDDQGIYSPVTGAEILDGMVVLAVSDEWGFYDIELEAGIYLLTCEAEGFDSITEEININAGEETEFDFILEPDSSNDDDLISTTTLLGNFPNPFNPSTEIRFQSVASESVILEVYNCKGEKVKTINRGQLQPGKHSIVWNGENNRNMPVSGGIYFYNLEIGQRTYTGKMTLLK